MAKSSALNLTQDLAGQTADFDNADGTTAKDVLGGTTEGQNVYGFYYHSDDTAERTLEIYRSDGTNETLVETLTITGPTSGYSGFGGPKDTAGNAYLPLPASWKLRGKMTSAVTASQAVTVSFVAEDYTV